ncbi:hypothetical protein JX265_010877 [Neoarthrinium moseri]|uniref:S-adenosyl-L-methionine-dependent methyltransferase n=1 Tax=Neoarthrinium moseri TaxID=1658444 RepID=A0A9P9WDL0_9PEZI|nr:uncharacterized protein JN550_009012 [Neoarthrinium moseri]KAI1846290.1 hypothetical protein JX266_007495 [Neoarthrinium moseri]KAI1858209.1 hypothetical protein JX265_010877 [Neoarthrinium moseri]KAI1864455.1 hypothetical protein JN550_009012 [Neoarthrinium moseri]
MRSSDVFTATSTPPGTPATQQTSRQSGHASGSHGPTAADILADDDRLSASSAEDAADHEEVEYFPAEDSSDEATPAATTATSILKRSSTQSSNRFIRYISKKFGRSFNKRAGFRGRAFLPNDEIERQRNLLQHELILDVLDGRLHLSPVRPKKALDIGCGPGVCNLASRYLPYLGFGLAANSPSLAQRYPDAQVLGIDVDPVRAPYHLPNCRFEVSDASQPWNYGGTFDFIHMRMVGELPIGKQKLFDTIYDHLKPGGWVEITEWLIKFQSPNHSLDKFNVWNHAFKKGLRTFGTTPMYQLAWKPIMEAKGCNNVTERKYPVPINPWPPGKRLQKQGSMMAENVQTFLEGATLPVFTGALGWPENQVRELLAGLKREVADEKNDGLLPETSGGFVHLVVSSHRLVYGEGGKAINFYTVCLDPEYGQG